jgi:branched-chain amino acid transport system permease protein
VLRLINFAHSEVFMLGTVGCLVGINVLGVGRNDPAKTGFVLIGSLLLCLVLAMAFSGATAVLLERVAYRPLRRRGASRLAALISAIGASFFLQELFAQPRLLGRNDHAFPRLLAKSQFIPKWMFDGLPAFLRHQKWVKDIVGDLQSDKVLVIVGAFAMMIALDRFVGLTRLGRGIRAVAQDPETATLMGVNIDRVVTLTFLLGGFMAGAAGLLFMVKVEQTNYFVGFLLGIKAFTAAVLGGIGNLRGALVGGLLLGLIESYGGAVFGSRWVDVVAFTALVFVLLFRPTGVLGETLSKTRA